LDFFLSKQYKVLSIGLAVELPESRTAILFF